jgi:hypothetical protein
VHVDAPRKRIEQAVNALRYGQQPPISVEEAIDASREDLTHAETPTRERMVLPMTEIVYLLVLDHPAAQEKRGSRPLACGAHAAIRALNTGEFVSRDELVVHFRRTYGRKPNYASSGRTAPSAMKDARRAGRIVWVLATLAYAGVAARPIVYPSDRTRLVGG